LALLAIGATILRALIEVANFSASFVGHTTLDPSGKRM
jgi:hypothetical protein